MGYIQRIKELWKKEKWYWCGAVILGLSISVLYGIHQTQVYARNIQGGIAAKVVRFHVLANSDSSEDQALKLAVRDAVLDEYGALLEGCESKAETIESMKAVQEEICKTALQVVLEHGYAYDVSVTIAREEFPYKRYDDLVFPAGVYDALRIEIGEAEGQNWWCVLYPQMCYVDASFGYTTEESYRKLENTLTDEEFLVVSALEQEEAMPKIKLKLVEWWKERE